MNTYAYDGSFEGLLTVVFEAYRTKSFPDEILSKAVLQFSFLSNAQFIETKPKLAERVLKGIQKKGSEPSISIIYKVFLSEQKGREMIIFKYISYIIVNPHYAEENYADPYVLKTKQITKQINREVHRMHAFVRFQKTTNGIYFSTIEPDFDVIPLIGEHFEKRYADQQWIIFDVKRNYGLYYNLTEVQEIRFSNEESNADNLQLDEDDTVYQSLWKKYFQSVNISERKNMKLHLQHVPRRYWKYLTEKKG